MSKNRDKEADKEATRKLILNPNRPKYQGGANWLGHGVGRSDGHARVDELLLDGATMERLEQERGGISSHFRSLKRDHDLLVTRGPDGLYRFDRAHLGLPDQHSTVEKQSAVPANKDDSSVAPIVYEPIIAADLEPPLPERVLTTVSRVVRDTGLAKRVKELHGHRCQLCGETIPLPDGTGYAEGHHLQPLGRPHNGHDVAENIVCLCPNHHAACDLGAIRLSTSDFRSVSGHTVGQSFIDYHNSTIYRGTKQVPPPASNPDGK